MNVYDFAVASSQIHVELNLATLYIIFEKFLRSFIIGLGLKGNYKKEIGINIQNMKEIKKIRKIKENI